MKSQDSKTPNIVILHSGGLSPRILFQGFIGRNRDLVSAIIELPTVPTRGSVKKTLAFYSKILSASYQYLVLNFFVTGAHDFITKLLGKDLNSYAAKLGIQTFRMPEIDQECLAKIRDISPDYIINASSFILKSNILDIPKFGTLNLHGARLPEYRGAANYFWVLINNESQTQLTLHYVDTGLDTGAIVGYGDIVPITQSTTILGLWIQVRSTASPLLERYATLFRTNQRLPSFKQNDQLAVTRSFPGRKDIFRIRKSGFRMMSISDLATFLGMCFRDDL